MTKTTYVATAPDGSQHTRKTDRTYTHAVLLEGNGPEGPVWGAVGFCGRPDLAEKKRGEHPGSIVVECGVLGDDKADMPEAEAAEDAPDADVRSPAGHEAADTSEQPRRTIGALVRELLMDEALGYGEIVDRVLEEFPDARTSVRSVASVAAVLRKRGVDVPMRRRSRS